MLRDLKQCQFKDFTKYIQEVGCKLSKILVKNTRRALVYTLTVCIKNVKRNNIQFKKKMQKKI